MRSSWKRRFCQSLLLGWTYWLIALHLVSAHAVLVRAEPAIDQVLSQPPTRIDLWFSEPVRISAQSLHVLGPDGRDYARSAPQQDTADPTHIWVMIDAHKQGTYRVTWRVISADSHLVIGSYQFSVGLVTAAPTTLTAPQSTVPIDAIARWLRLLAISVITGSALFIALAQNEMKTFPTFYHRVLTQSRRGALIGILAVLLWISGQALGLFGDLQALADPQNLSTILGGLAGLAWFSQGLLFVAGYALAVWLARKSSSAATGSLLGLSCLLCLGNSLSSHASATAPVIVSIVVDFVHLAAAALWLGGIITLGLLWNAARHDALPFPPLQPLFQRFGIIALAALYVTLISGAYQLWVNVGQPSDLVTTSYGRILLLKGALILILTAFGAMNMRHSWQRASFAQAQQSTWRILRGEMSVTLLLLITIGILTALPPARSAISKSELADSTQQDALVLAEQAGTYLAILQLRPAQPGPNEVTITLRDNHGESVRNATVNLISQPEQASIQAPPSAVTLENVSGAYRGTLVVPQAGMWTMTVHIEQPGQPPVSTRFQLRLPVPDAKPLLERADAAMNQLQTLQEVQTLSNGITTITTTIHYQAPDRMAYTVETSNQPPHETIVIGNQRYDRIPGESWQPSQWPGDTPFRWPDYHFAQQAQQVRLLDVVPCGSGSALCYLLSFADPTSDAYYRMWVDSQSWLILRYEMMAVAHFMTVEYSHFNEATAPIMAPTGS
ncbi:MAG: copper resistance protein CopC [Thermorudis peleae]|nr:copper resistance protein CopC [Thermorudis peleae]